MSTKTNDGDVYRVRLLGQSEPPPVEIAAMPLRDFFAAHALQGMLAHSDMGWNDADKNAQCAYRYADAMLRAREAKSNG